MTTTTNSSTTASPTSRHRSSLAKLTEAGGLPAYLQTLWHGLPGMQLPGPGLTQNLHRRDSSGLITSRHPEMQPVHPPVPPKTRAAQQPPAQQDCVQKEHTSSVSVVHPCAITATLPCSYPALERQAYLHGIDVAAWAASAVNPGVAIPASRANYVGVRIAKTLWFACCSELASGVPVEIQRDLGPEPGWIS